MLRTFFFTLRRLDWFLFGAVTLAMIIGLSALYSTSLSVRTTGSEGGVITSLFGARGNFQNFSKQAFFIGLGLVAIVVIATINYRMLAGVSPLLLVIGGIALLAVLFLGQTIRGTRGWFGIGGFGIQPIEFVKVFLVIFLARYFARNGRDPDRWRPIIGSGLVFMSLFALVLFQPDLGSALVLLALWVVMLLMSGLRRSHVAIMFGLFCVVAAVSWLFFLKPYQRGRIADFIDPTRDPRGRGYNVTQSVIAIGSGGVLGRGLGFGSQSQLRFLPERQTDFIFAVVAEEMGFIGVTVVLLLFGTVFYRGYLVAKKTRDDFALFFVIGSMVMIAAETTINIGGNLRLLPVTGIALPFISYGGSALLAKCCLIGVLESVAVRT